MPGNQWPAPLEFAHQEILTFLFGPGQIIAQPQVIHHFRNRLGMTGRLLADVQANQRQAKGVGAANGVQQRTIGNGFQPAVHQGPITKLQRPGEVLVGKQNAGGVGGLAGNPGFRPVPGFDQFFPQPGQHLAIGLPGITNDVPQLITGLPHGQFRTQGLDVPQVEIGCHPAAQQEHLAGYFMGHIGVAIAITAHPGGDPDGRRIQR